MQLPSASNVTGTLLGSLAGAAVVGFTPSLPFVIAGAAALGMTPIGLAGILGLLATSLVNMGVTHIAELKNLNDLVGKWYPQVVQSYPAQSSPSSVKTPNNIYKG